MAVRTPQIFHGSLEFLVATSTRSAILGQVALKGMRVEVLRKMPANLRLRHANPEAVQLLTQ